MGPMLIPLALLTGITCRMAAITMLAIMEHRVRVDVIESESESENVYSVYL